MQVEYGGVKVSSKKQEDAPESPLPIIASDAPQNTGVAVVANQHEISDEYIKTLESLDSDKLRNLVSQWRMQAYIWEYRYLNRFLVFNTRRFLVWLYKKNVTVSLAHAHWSQFIPSLDERNAIYEAAYNHHLVEVLDDHTIRLTPKGEEYVELFCGDVREVLDLLGSTSADGKKV